LAWAYVLAGLDKRRDCNMQRQGGIGDRLTHVHALFASDCVKRLLI